MDALFFVPVVRISFDDAMRAFRAACAADPVGAAALNAAIEREVANEARAE